MKRKGFTLIEILILASLIGGAFALGRLGELPLNSLQTWLMGLSACSLVFAVVCFACDMIFGGIPRLPVCRNTKCRAGDYKPVRVASDYLLECKCGDHYVLRGREFHRVEGGIEWSYMKWKALCGWRSDVRKADEQQKDIPREAMVQYEPLSERVIMFNLFFLNFSRCRTYLYELPVGSLQNIARIFYDPKGFVKWVVPTPAGGIGLVIIATIAFVFNWNWGR